MPTYEYSCPEGHQFELIQKMSGKPRVKCPTCGKLATRKISGGAGLVFKGTGFYITDYGKDGKGPRKEADQGAGEKPASDKAVGDKPPGDKPASDKPASDKPTSDQPAAKQVDKPAGKKKAPRE